MGEVFMRGVNVVGKVSFVGRVQGFIFQTC